MKWHMFLPVLMFSAALAMGCGGGTTGTPDSGTDGNVQPDGNVTPPSGHPAQATVSGGNIMQSPGYRLILTTGEGPGGNTNASSTNHQLQGGLVGATQ
jgi:hypothetical protein